MSDFTDYMEGIIQDWMSQGVDAPTAPATIYVGLHTADPGEAPDGSNEVAAGDYSRVGVTAGTGFNTGTSGDASTFSNANLISFSQATSDWGVVSHVSLWDSATAGNAIAAYALNNSKSINTNDTAEFEAGDLSFQID